VQRQRLGVKSAISQFERSQKRVATVIAGADQRDYRCA
jgi:hypothetical protein